MTPTPFSSVDLGLILKKLGHEHSMLTFDKRLELQKKIYILQMHGIYQGYDFSYYLRGPYCSKLARDGFALEKFYNEIEDFNENVYHDEPVQERFMQVKKFIKELKTPDNYEIAASLHLLHKTKSWSKEKIIEEVVNKVERFTVTQCKTIWNKLEEYGFVTNG